MARVLFISNVPTPYQLDFIDALGFENDVAAFFLWSKAKNLSWEGLTSTKVQIFNYDGSKESNEFFFREVSSFNPDFVLIGGHRLPVSSSTVSYCKKNNISVSYWLEKPLPANRLKRLARKIYWSFLFAKVNSIFCIGIGACNVYKHYAKNIVNLPYSIDVMKYRVKERNSVTLPLKFLFVGQLIHRKGIIELLDAFSLLSKDEATLSVCGDGDLKDRVNDFCDRYANIDYLGFLQPSELSCLFAEYDVLVLPSRHDGWAVVVCEAMASGLAIVGTRCTGAVEQFVEDNFNGHLCIPERDSILGAVMKYVQSPSSVYIHGAKNRVLAESSLISSKNAALCLNTYLFKGNTDL